VGKRVAVSEAETTGHGSHRRTSDRAHSLGVASRRARVLGVGVLAATLVVGGVLAATGFLGSDDAATSAEATKCGTSSVTIGTTFGLAPPLRNALLQHGCTNILVEAVEPGDLATALISGGDAPDYWIPDSAVWVDRVAEATGTPLEPLVDSVASSPVVVASASAHSPGTWPATLAGRGLVLGDPREDGSSAASLALSTGGASRRQAVTVIAPQAQRQAAAAAAPKTEQDRLQSIDAADAGYTTVTEQAVVASGRDLTATVPRGGTWLLTYPLVETAVGQRSAEITDTTDLLAGFVASQTFRTALTGSSFRAPGGHRLPNGVGRVEVVAPPEPASVSVLLSSWATLAVATRTLAVIDVSGSMDLDTDAGSRIDLTVEATRAGMALFPDGASVGLWAFSERLGRGTDDYRELLPIRRLDAYVDRRTQREQLSADLGGLPRLTDGGTGLYDTALAAYREVLRDYDPTAVNSVLLFSDGANDDPGSGSLDGLVSRLGQLADPGRPVSIITIGISGDADVKALHTIADATGGFSLVARQPADMKALFQRAMTARFS